MMIFIGCRCGTRQLQDSYPPLLAAVGGNCTEPTDGKRVHTIIEAMLNQGYSVMMDFQGVKIVSPEFYEAAVGDLEVTFPEPRLTAVHLSFESATEGSWPPEQSSRSMPTPN